jgi:hypothetical protein
MGSIPTVSMRTNGDLVSGSDVIAEGKIGLRQALSLEQAAIRVPSDQIVKPATHSTGDNTFVGNQQGRTQRTKLLFNTKALERCVAFRGSY